MGTESSKSHTELRGRDNRKADVDRNRGSAEPDTLLTVQAYQAILARELLMSESSEQDQKYF